MNRVAVSAEEVPLPKWENRLKKYVRAVLALLEKDKWDLSVLICGDTTITRLNSRYRGKNEATDVLSFAFDDGEKLPTTGTGGRVTPGDIVISLDTLAENARRFNISMDEELRRLVIHGILHLDGRDHKSNDPGEPMLTLQEKILTELSGENIIGRKE